MGRELVSLSSSKQGFDRYLSYLSLRCRQPPAAWRGFRHYTICGCCQINKLHTSRPHGASNPCCIRPCWEAVLWLTSLSHKEKMIGNVSRRKAEGTGKHTVDIGGNAVTGENGARSKEQGVTGSELKIDPANEKLISQ